MTEHKPILEWRLDANTSALVAASDQHLSVYVITETDGGWQLDHPWAVTSRLKTAMPKMCASLWEAIRVAERMERGDYKPDEVQP